MRFIICFLLINIGAYANLKSTLRTDALIKADKALSLLLPYQTLTYPLASPLQRNIFINSVPEFQLLAKNYGYFSEHPLASKVTLDLKDVQITIDILKLIYEKIDDPFLRSFAIDEILCKVLAYRNLSDKQQISIGPVLYEIDIVIDLWQGMPAFGLIPKQKGSAPPLLIFRGTDLSFLRGLPSIYSDLDPKGPGFTVFLNAKPKIHKWLEKVGKAKVLGVSLGGALAAYTAIFEKDHILEAITFNMAGISQENFNKWREEKPPLKSYVIQGDFVAKIGHTVGDIKVASSDLVLYPIATHTTLISFLPKFYLSDGYQ